LIDVSSGPLLKFHFEERIAQKKILIMNFLHLQSMETSDNGSVVDQTSDTAQASAARNQVGWYDISLETE
jgi:hypothetical protein